MLKTWLQLQLNSIVNQTKVSCLVLNNKVFGIIKNSTSENKVPFGEFASALWTLERRDDELEIVQATGSSLALENSAHVEDVAQTDT
jgi:hypothetical protein